MPSGAVLPRDGAARPAWSPDAGRIAFDGNYSKPYIKSIAGASPETALWEAGHPIYDWSRDGRWLIFGGGTPSAREIWIMPQFGDKKPFPYPHGDYNEQDAKLSPDGRWLAYSSDRPKRDEIYVASFPEPGRDWQVSTSGGNYPVWSRDGRELYYLSPERQMIVVSVQAGSQRITPGPPKALFQAGAMAPFDVSNDGRFLIQVPVEPRSANAPLIVITNWQSALKK